MPSSPSTFSLHDRPLSVVVADDVLEIQRLVQLWLTEVGCAVTAVSSGNQVIQLLREKPFDLIVTDIIMPDGDGVEVITEVKRTQPKARVLAISGGGHHLKAVDCLKIAKGLGAHAILLKPFNREQLLDAVNQLVRPAHTEQAQSRADSTAGA